MQQNGKDLVILAAGIGSRFKGNIKQLQRVGPAGECIMDYSIYDAVQAGFTRIVFIIRKEIETLFEELIGKRVRRFCQVNRVEVVCVYQEISSLPDGFQCPSDRKKPWGTGHALLCCKGVLQHKFAIINADDIYGKDAFFQIAAFLDSINENSVGAYALAGFQLSNTLSDHGGVTRGLCEANAECFLTSIQEVRNIIKTVHGPAVENSAGISHLNPNTPVSMNMWAFTTDVLDLMEQQFTKFLENGGLADLSSEFLIPSEVGSLLEKGINVKVLPVASKWFGLTYIDDAELVRNGLLCMTQDKTYPSPLF